MMTRLHTWIVPALGLMLTLVAGCGRRPAETRTGAAATPTVLPPNQSWIVVKERVFIPVVDDLGAKLAAAEGSFDGGEQAAGGEELRQAAAILERQAATATGVSQAELTDAAVRLQAVSEELTRGRPVAPEQLDDAVDDAWQAEVDCRWAGLAGRDWTPFVREPERYLELALAGFEGQDRSAAGDDLRKAAAFVRMEAARGADVGEKERLVAAAMDLRELAAEVDEGSVHDVGRVEVVLARTAHAVSLLHQLRAAADAGRGDPASAAAALDAAATYLDRALEWSGSTVPPATGEVLSDARAVAAEVQANPAAAGERLPRAIAAVGDELQRLGGSLDTELVQKDLRSPS